MSDANRDRRSNAAGAKWFEYRLAEWRAAAQKLEALERGKSAAPDTVLDAVRAYPEIARDLAIARRAAPNGPLTKYLEGVYLQLHRSLFRPPSDDRRAACGCCSRATRPTSRTSSAGTSRPWSRCSSRAPPPARGS